MQPIGAVSGQIRQVTQRLRGLSSEELDSLCKSSLTPISPQELAAAREAERNAPRTLEAGAADSIKGYICKC